MTRGFRLYLEHFNTYNKAYGSLGAVMILMLWLYLTAIVMMIGGTINAVLRAMQEERERETADATVPVQALAEDPQGPAR